MKTNTRLFFTFVIIAPLFLQAQESPLLLDKQGTFRQVDFGLYTHWDCGYTKAETAANYKRITAIIDSLRQRNPVLREGKGFNGQATLFAVNCDPAHGYGIAGSVRMEFQSWFRNKNGKEVFSSIEPPSWYFQYNLLDPFHGAFNYGGPGGNEPPKAGFDAKRFKNICDKLKEFIYAPGPKQTVQPGIDRWGDAVVVYNPARPPYWTPVTVREVYDLLFPYWEAFPDSLQSALALKMLKEEYAGFTEAERNSYAYSIGKGGLAQIGLDATSRPVMRLNPAYWNKALPRSAIQLLSFTLPANKNYLQSRAEEWRQHNSISYHEARFEASLEVATFGSLIDR